MTCFIRNLYEHITFRRNNGSRRAVFVHNVVKWTFHGPPVDPRMSCYHINRNRLDNRLLNLEWVSPVENRIDRRINQAT